MVSGCGEGGASEPLNLLSEAAAPLAAVRPCQQLVVDCPSCRPQAENQTLPSGTKMVHGQQGKVTGPGTGDRKHTHVKVHSPNYTCCAIRCIRCLPIVHTTAVCLSNLKVLFSGNTKSIGCRANDVRRPLAHPSFRPPYPPPRGALATSLAASLPRQLCSEQGGVALARDTVKGGRRGWEGRAGGGVWRPSRQPIFTVWELQCHMCTGTKVQLVRFRLEVCVFVSVRR